MVTKELNETQDTYIFLFLASLSCEKAPLWDILGLKQSYNANLVPPFVLLFFLIYRNCHIEQFSTYFFVILFV